MTCITLPFQFGALLLHFSLLGVHVTALVAVHNNKVMTIQPTLLVLFAPAALLAGVLAQVVFGKLLSARAKGILAVLCAAPSLAAVLLLFPAVHGSGAIDVSSISWDGPASLVFHVDALSLLFALMGTAIGLIVLIYSVSYMEEERAATRFYALMLTFIAGLVGLVFFANLLLMYVCWEVVGLCSFGLVGYWYKNPEAVRGARKVLLMTHLAGYGLLAALLELPSFFYIAAGFTSHSLFAEIGSAREAVLSISYNVVFLIAVIAIAVSQHTFRLEELAQPSTSLLRWLGTLAILACIPAKLHLNPFSVSVWALLMDNLRRRTVTLRFPTRPPTCNRYRGLVHINTEPCKCCGICAVVCTSAAITMKKGDGKYEWSYDAGQCTFCGRCVDSCALKLLTMEAAPPPIYETSGALKQSHRWEAKPTKAPAPEIEGSRSPSEPGALTPEYKTSLAEEVAK